MDKAVKLSQLDDSVMVFQEDEYVITANELREAIVRGDEERRKGWIIGIPTEWTPDARYMFENYIENESEEMFEDADETMWDQIDPLINQIQTVLDNVKVSYYKAGDDVEIDIEPSKDGDK